MFGLKMMVKSGLKNIFEIPPCAKPFFDLLIYFIKAGFLPQITKFINMFAHGGISILFNSERPVRTEKSSIFNFEYVNEV